jgi:hypothetical protein
MFVFLRHRVMTLVGVSLLVSVTLPMAYMQSASASSCRGVKVGPRHGIQRAVNAHAAHTTFCMTRGIYRVKTSIRPKDGDTFVGAAQRRAGVIVKTGSAQIIFELDGTDHVTFRHFSIKGARNACPRRNCGETGRAISRGSDVTVIRMHLSQNGLNGIGGTSGILTVKHSEIDHNGAGAGDGVSGGIKSVESLFVSDSNVHDNRGNGLWCDIQCGNFTVIGSHIIHNSGSGIFDEISQGAAMFRGNTIKRNNTVGDRFRGGLSITNSKNVVARHNTFKRNTGFGIGAQMDRRVNCGNPDETCGYVISNVRFHHNNLRHDSVVGCRLAGVICSKNR